MKNVLYPVNINLKGKKCLVIGAGEVAFRKVKSLLDCSAKVKVVSPVLIKKFDNLRKNKNFKYVKRKFKKNDLKEIFLVISATNDSMLNQKIANYAKKENILINVVDNPELCTFLVPSIIKRGPLIISISTSGEIPFLSKLIRKELEKKFNHKFGGFIEKAGKIRKSVLNSNPEVKRKFFTRLEKLTKRYLS